MIRRELVVNYPGILISILTIIGCYYLLSYVLDKKNISGRNRKIIITASIISIIALFFILKLLIYKKICIETGTAETAYTGEDCQRSILFWK